MIVATAAAAIRLRTRWKVESLGGIITPVFRIGLTAQGTELALGQFLARVLEGAAAARTHERRDGGAGRGRGAHPSVRPGDPSRLASAGARKGHCPATSASPSASSRGQRAPKRSSGKYSCLGWPWGK